MCLVPSLNIVPWQVCAKYFLKHAIWVVHAVCKVYTMFVCLAGCVGAKPSLLDILSVVVPTIAAKWGKVGQALGVEPEALDTVRRSEHREDGRALELLALWSQSAAGTGSLPRTWHSLLAAVETVIGRREREKIEAKLNTLSPSPVFDENCQAIVSVYKPQVINYAKNACQLGVCNLLVIQSVDCEQTCCDLHLV